MLGLAPWSGRGDRREMGILRAIVKETGLAAIWRERRKIGRFSRAKNLQESEKKPVFCEKQRFAKVIKMSGGEKGGRCGAENQALAKESFRHSCKFGGKSGQAKVSRRKKVTISRVDQIISLQIALGLRAQ